MKYCISLLFLICSFFASSQTQQPLGSVDFNKFLRIDTAYSGACAKRVGLTLTGTQKQTGQAKRMSEFYYDIAMSYAKDKILALCPKAQIIEVSGDVVGERYLYTKSSGWQKEWKPAGASGMRALVANNNSVNLLLGAQAKKFVGFYGVNYWGVMSGDVDYVIENNKVASLKITGTWHDVGDLTHTCKEESNGYAYWGAFSMDIAVDGSLSTIKRTTCSKTITPSSKLADWLVVDGMYQPGKQPKKGTLNVRIREMIANFEISKVNLNLQQNAASTTSESREELSLAYLGYIKSEYQFTENNVDFYLAYATESQSKPYLVALHDKADNEALLEIERHKVKQNNVPGFRLSKKELGFYKRKVLSKFADKQAWLMLSIRHYNKSKSLINADFPYFSRTPDDVSIAPVLSTMFRLDNGEPFYDFANEELYFLPTDSAISVAEANENRLRMNEVEKEGALARAKEREDKKAAISQKENTRFIGAVDEVAAQRLQDGSSQKVARQNGRVYRDWLYWAQYYYGPELASILNGDLKISNKDKVFRVLVKEYVEQYSSACSEYLGSDAVSFVVTMTTTETDVFGTHSESEQTTIWVKKRFARIYDSYYKRNEIIGPVRNDSPENLIHDLAQILKNNPNNPGSMATSIAKPAIKLVIDNKNLLLAEKCDSGFIRQLEDNIYRIANNQPPVQKAGIETNYALNDATPPYFRSPLFKACTIHSGPVESDGWCNCIDASFSGILSGKEKQKYSGNYPQFLREISLNPIESIKANKTFYPKYEQCINAHGKASYR